MPTPAQLTELRQSLAVLVQHNKWRRCDDGSTPMVGPVETGRAMDTVAELVPGLIDHQQPAPVVDAPAPFVWVRCSEAQPFFHGVFRVLLSNGHERDCERSNKGWVGIDQREVSAWACTSSHAASCISDQEAAHRLVDKALTVIRELRQKLAIAGVEGSPPPFETTSGALRRKRDAALARGKELEAAPNIENPCPWFKFVPYQKKDEPGTTIEYAVMRKPISVSITQVQNNHSTQCDYIRTAICDDGSIWESTDKSGWCKIADASNFADQDGTVKQQWARKFKRWDPATLEVGP